LILLVSLVLALPRKMRAGNVELNEDVLGVVVEFVGMRGATAVRACKQLRDVAARVAWRDHSVRVLGSRLRRGRACFPRAQAMAVRSAKDEDLQWVEGVLDVDFGGLYSCTSITDEGLRHLGSVTTLNLSYCRLITDEGLRHLGSVTTLNLSYCSNITDEGLRHLGSVTTLDLTGYSFSNSKITDEGLRHLGSVTTLNLSYCGLITDEGLRHLGSVTTLDLTGCGLIPGWGQAYLEARGVRVTNR